MITLKKLKLKPKLKRKLIHHNGLKIRKQEMLLKKKTP
jgi:hypothetical protein